MSVIAAILRRFTRPKDLEWEWARTYYWESVFRQGVQNVTLYTECVERLNACLLREGEVNADLLRPEELASWISPGKADAIRLLATLALGYAEIPTPLKTRLLLPCLDDENDIVRRTAAAFLLGAGELSGLIAVAGGCRHGHSIRSAAACELARMGPAASEAIPVLCEGLCDSGLTFGQRCPFISALVAIGPASIPELRKRLRPDNPHGARFAMMPLIEMGRRSAMVEPDLIELLQSPHADLRIDAADALWRIYGNRGGETALREQLGSRDWGLQLRAAAGLWSMGVSDGRAFILKAIKTANARRIAATLREVPFAKVAEMGQEFTDAVRPLLKHRDEDVREAATCLLELVAKETATPT